MILRAAILLLAMVFVFGLAQTQPWLHPAWTHDSAERFFIVMGVTTILTLLAHKYWFYGIMLLLACSVGLLPIAGLAFVLLAALNLGTLAFHQRDDRLNLLGGFAIYVWIFSLTASLPINTIWLWGPLLAAPIAIKRRVPIPLPQPSLPVAIPLVANFLLALKPEVSADGLSMHFAIAQWVKDHARFHFDAADQIWSVQPMAGDWALTLANLFGGEPTSRLLNYVWLLIIVSFVYRILRRHLEYAPAALLTGIFASTPLLQLTSTSLFIENFWTVMIVGALVAAEQEEFVLAATLAGASAASKLLGLIPVPLVAAYGLLKKPKWKPLLAGAAIFTAIAAVPYVRAFIVTGNPVYHYANAVFKSPLMRSDVNFADPRFPARFTWHTLYDVTFKTELFVESEPGTAGYQWLWFIPLSLLALMLQIRIRGATMTLPLVSLFTALLLITVVFTRQASLRYVEPAMPLLTIAFAPVAAMLLESLPRVTTVIALVIFALNLYQTPASGGYHRDFALLPFSQQERNDYLTRLAPARRLIEEMNKLDPNAPLAHLDGDEIAGLKGPVYTSTWHTPEFAGKLAVTHSVEGYVRLLKQFRIEYVIAPRQGHWRYLEDSALERFLTTATDPIATNGNLQLVKVKFEPIILPPAPATKGTYDDSNARIDYGGPWYLDQSFAEPAQRTVSYSDDPHATIKFTFEGTSITYYYTKARNRGEAQIQIDGHDPTLLNLYSLTPQWQRQTTFDHLPPGVHTIVIRHAGPPKSFIDLDQFVVK